MRALVRRLLIKLGYVPDWFTADEFIRAVGRPPCARCVVANEGERDLILCERDLDDWFDAVLS